MKLFLISFLQKKDKLSLLLPNEFTHTAQELDILIIQFLNVN